MMNSWLMKVLTKLIRKRYALFKTLTIVALILSLTGCGDKAVSQDVSISLPVKPVRQENAQLSTKISEVAPPEIIQELRQALEIYQPQVQILSPKSDEVLKEDKLKVRLQVKDLPIFKNAQYGLGSHLKLILDNQPGLEIYDLDKPLELSDLSPGTHTLRVFASRPWDESFKNEGAYAQTKFHVFTKSDDNAPNENLPTLTYNSPQDSYGAEPILLDFYLTKAPLHILAKDNPDNPISDWRIRCTINGESFIIDRWQSLYLKGFNSGKNWVKLEFLDNQGNPVKNVFNSTVRVIDYQPEGKDTLAQIVRGELSAEDLRGIVDANYAVEIPTETTPETQLEERAEKSEGGFFNRFKRGKEDKTPTPQPTVEATPEVIETPQPETSEPDATEETIPEVKSEEIMIEENPEIIETPASIVEETPEVIETPTPEVTPEVIETPQAEATPEATPEVIETPTPEVTPEAEANQESTPPATLPEIVAPSENEPITTQPETIPETKQSTTERLRGYFKLPKTKTPEVEEAENVEEIETQPIPE